MKSVWMLGHVRRAVRQLDAVVARVKPSPLPYAIWQVAFSSKSVSKKVTPAGRRVSAVDERDLAEPARAVVAVELRRDDVFPAITRFDVDDPSALERQLEPSTTTPPAVRAAASSATVPSVRRRPAP